MSAPGSSKSTNAEACSSSTSSTWSDEEGRQSSDKNVEFDETGSSAPMMKNNVSHKRSVLFDSDEDIDEVGDSWSELIFFNIVHLILSKNYVS